MAKRKRKQRTIWLGTYRLEILASPLRYGGWSIKFTDDLGRVGRYEASWVYCYSSMSSELERFMKEELPRWHPARKHYLRIKKCDRFSYIENYFKGEIACLS